MVRDVLRMLDRSTRVVHSLVAFAWRCMESELDLVETIRETEDREVGALNH